MTWSTDRPIEPGWYWYWHPISREAIAKCVYRLQEVNGDISGNSDMLGITWLGDEFKALDELGYEWWSERVLPPPDRPKTPEEIQDDQVKEKFVRHIVSKGVK